MKIVENFLQNLSDGEQAISMVFRAVNRSEFRWKRNSSKSDGSRWRFTSLSHVKKR